MMSLDICFPNWEIPKHVFAFSTTSRMGNLALHVDDDPAVVLQNRALLRQRMNLPQEPEWLEQIHSNRCILVDNDHLRCGDAAITRQANRVLAIMTADCLPILLCNAEGTEVAAIHAGWKGLLTGIIENTLREMKSAPDTIQAWIGPGICGTCYQVDNNLREQFVNKNASLSRCFQAAHEKNKSIGAETSQKWCADLSSIARMLLAIEGVNNVSLSQLCTYEQEETFYSYRRSPNTGRIASLIGFI